MSTSVAIYARVSSDRQAREQTIASQVAALRERVAQDGFTLSESLTFLDDGRSGVILDRPALERDHERRRALAVFLRLGATSTS